ncbi:MAG TPA: RsmE family RNA methyltransferase [Flavobacteriales bacterium]
MHLFHCADLATELVELPEEEAHHATGVLRLGVGSVVGLLDGKGTSASAELIEVAKKRCVARMLSREHFPAERAARIHIAVAPTKQMDRYEWFLEKATEIGVDRITPLTSKRTERDKLRHDRMERLLISAMKQSQRKWLPQLDAQTPLETIARNEAPQRFFGWCEGEHTPFTELYDPGQDALLLIGPEGDFTAEEAELLRSKGFRAVSLGAARLRTETAALAGCTWMSFAQQR